MVIVPSRGRPHIGRELAEAFAETCTAHTELVIAVDVTDPSVEDYERATEPPWPDISTCLMVNETTTMVEALNHVAAVHANLNQPPSAIAFMGDDHRPRTKGWDTAYLEALNTRPGLVYGNDLVQGERLPTQVAISAGIVRALGHMAPPVLRHLYVDNYWLALGRATGRITYLPDVIVEHLHPVAGTAEMDDGYRRVNDQAMYKHDENAYASYWHTHGARDIRALRQAVAG